MAARRLRQEVKGNLREQGQLKKLTQAVGWEKIVSVLEQVKAESWAEFSQRHGDWGREVPS